MAEQIFGAGKSVGEMKDAIFDRLADIATAKQEDMLRLANVVAACSLWETKDAGGGSLSNVQNPNGSLKTLEEAGLNPNSGQGKELNDFAIENGYPGGWNEYQADVDKFGMGKEAGGLTAGGPIRIQAAQQDKITTPMDAVLSSAKGLSGIQKKIAQNIQAIGQG